MTLETGYANNNLMEDPEGSEVTEKETPQVYPFAAIVPLPYTEIERDVDPGEVKRNVEQNLPGPRTTHQMSHFTARTILAAWELYDQKQAPKFIIPGELKDPSTADLERDFLVNNRKIDHNKIKTYPDLNGTLQQLEPVAKLQREGKLGPVLIVAFEFHMERAEEIKNLLGIEGEVVEVEQTHADYLKQHGASRVDRDELVNLPQVQEVKAKEKGPIGLIWQADKKMFGARAPISRVLKHFTGATVTNIKGYEGSTGKKAETQMYFPRFKRNKNNLSKKK